MLVMSRLCHVDVSYSIQSTVGEDERQSMIEDMLELTGRQLDCDVIEMILSESNWKGNSQVSSAAYMYQL